MRKSNAIDSGRDRIHDLEDRKMALLNEQQDLIVHGAHQGD